VEKVTVPFFLFKSVQPRKDSSSTLGWAKG